MATKGSVNGFKARRNRTFHVFMQNRHTIAKVKVNCIIRGYPIDLEIVQQLGLDAMLKVKPVQRETEERFY